jgi:hypothetical protein
MRVCIKHMEKAVMTLSDKFEGTEYDFCQKCKNEFLEILLTEFIPADVKPEVKRGRKRIT